jgi:hypothetical protein
MLAYITSINQLILFTEVIGVYFLIHMKRLRVLWEKKPEFCNFKAGGIEGNHPVLKGQSISDFASHFHRTLFVSPYYATSSYCGCKKKKGTKKER